MPTCRECGQHDQEDANFLTPAQDICIQCGPHVLVQRNHDQITVELVNCGQHASEVSSFKLPEEATAHAKELSSEGLIILYKGFSWTSNHLILGGTY